MPTLHLQDVHLTRGITPVFAGLQLELTEDRIGLIGNNGAGKTSLLRLLCGLEAPDQGSIHIDGMDVHQRDGRLKRSQRIGMMFQNPDDQIIFPTVEEELALGLPGLKKREALQKAREFLAQRGLSDWAQRAISATASSSSPPTCWTTCAPTRACCGWTRARSVPTAMARTSAQPTKRTCASSSLKPLTLRKPLTSRKAPAPLKPLIPPRARRLIMGSLYSDIPSWLHRVPAGLKLALLVLLGLVLFWVKDPLILGIIAGLALALWLSLGRATRPARRLMFSVLVAAGLVALFQLWMGRPDLAWSATVRLACTCSLGAVLTVTTRPAALLDVLEWLLQPLRLVGLSPERLALQLGLMLRFIEHFFVQWKKLDDAWRLRTGRPGGWRLIAPLTIQMLQTTRRVADALFARLGD